MSQNCDRCGSPTYVTTMSYFNMDIVCDECDDLEKLHPGYHEAKAAEVTQVEKGNFNFEGIGLPAGYREWARAKKQEISAAFLVEQKESVDDLFAVRGGENE